jgi:hypothetical protein
MTLDRMIEIHTRIGQRRFQPGSARRPSAVSKIAHILKFLNLKCGVAVTPSEREREKNYRVSQVQRANDHNARVARIPRMPVTKSNKREAKNEKSVRSPLTPLSCCCWCALCNSLEERETIKEQLFVCCCEWRQVFFSNSSRHVCGSSCFHTMRAQRAHTCCCPCPARVRTQRPQPALTD